MYTPLTMILFVAILSTESIVKLYLQNKQIYIPLSSSIYDPVTLWIPDWNNINAYFLAWWITWLSFVIAIVSVNSEKQYKLFYSIIAIFGIKLVTYASIVMPSPSSSCIWEPKITDTVSNIIYILLCVEQVCIVPIFTELTSIPIFICLYAFSNNHAKWGLLSMYLTLLLLMRIIYSSDIIVGFLVAFAIHILFKEQPLPTYEKIRDV